MVDAPFGKAFGFAAGSTVSLAFYTVEEDGETTTDRTIRFQLNRSHDPLVYSTDLSRTFTVTVIE